jgi:hypothetical protein
VRVCDALVPALESSLIRDEEDSGRGVNASTVDTDEGDSCLFDDWLTNAATDVELACPNIVQVVSARRPNIQAAWIVFAVYINRRCSVV